MPVLDITAQRFQRATHHTLARGRFAIGDRVLFWEQMDLVGVALGGRLLRQPEMGSVLMIVANVLDHEAF